MNEGILSIIIRAFPIPAELVEAIIEVESSGNRYAYNPEPHYRWFWDMSTNAPFRSVSDDEVADKYPPMDFPKGDQEWWAQQASWGLMQVMGAVAREMGYKGTYLSGLTEPSLNVVIGCTYLSVLKDRHYDIWGWAGVVRAYNTGSPEPSSAGQQYLQKVANAMGVEAIKILIKESTK